MKTIYFLCIISSFINGLVSDEKVSVYDGDSVTLHTDLTGTQRDYLIEWRFGDQQDLIARIRATSLKIYDEDLDGRFRDRLQVNNQTGDLTITNITTQQTGDYKLDIRSRSRTTKTFNISVSGDKVKTVAVGDSVILVNNVIKKPGDEKMVLRIQHNNSPVAEMNGTVITYNANGERFRDRLQVYYHTGDLIFTDIRPDDSGSYEVDITVGSHTYTIHRSFSVNVKGGWSSGSGAGISVFFSLLIAAAVAVVFHHKISQTKPLDKKRVEKGHNAVIQADLKELKSGDKIEWRFGQDTEMKDPVIMWPNWPWRSPGTLIAECDKEGRNTYNGPDERFKDKLSLNSDNGDLTISDVSNKHSGVYQLKLTSGGETSYRRFIVSVIERIVVDEGKSVNLKTEVTDIQRDEKIEWRFKETLIAKINPANNIFSTYDGDDDLFKDKLKLNHQTGDLTINDIRHKHTGDYTLKIIRDGENSYRSFNVSLCGTTEEMLVQEDTADLKAKVKDIKRVDVIEWRFRETLIAEINFANNIFSTSNDDLFRDKLKLNDQTGDLTINDFREEHAGVYELKIISGGKTTIRKLIVFVIDDGVEQLHVNEGDYYTLKTKVTDIKRGDVIKWEYGDEQTVIAEINPAHNIFSTYDGDKWEFINKLELNHQTGDLTIFDIRYMGDMEDMEVFILKIIRNGKTTFRRFDVTVRDTTEGLEVYEGESVDLKTKVTDIQRVEKIEWRFRDENEDGEEFRDEEILIAEINPANKIFRTYDGYDDLFKDKLKLNDQTGDLNISDFREKHNAEYILKITRNGKPTYRRFFVSVRGEREEMLTVRKGESVHLKTDLDIQKVDLIEWRFGETLIAKINPANKSPTTSYNDLFRDKLTLNPQTGDLTISDFRKKHDGVYTLKIIRDGENLYRKFRVYAMRVIYFTGESKELNVNKGESVDLKTEVTNIQRDDVIEWRFEETLIAELNPANNISNTYDGDDDEFRDKLEINPQTGDLTINDFRKKHTGVYELKIIRDGEISYKRFRVFVGITVLDVFEAESVDLKTEVEDIQRVEKIEWRFKETLIAEINPVNNIFSTYDGDDDLFRDKLKLNHQTGDLTISDSRWKHSGEYELKIIRDKKSLCKRLVVCVTGVTSKTLEVYEGSSVDMMSDLTAIRRDDLIEWRFEQTLIAKIYFAKNISSTYDDNDLFRDKLKLNHKTGDLNIKDIRQKHNGVYKLKIIRGRNISYMRFIMSVRASEREDPVETRGGDSVRIEMQPLLNNSSQ